MKKKIKEKTDIAVTAAPDQAAAQPQQQESTRAKINTKSTGNGAEKAAKTTTATVSPNGESSKSEDKAKLKQCEDVIRANEGSEFETGRNLAQINDEELYKVAGFTAFDAYTRQRWGMSDKHAYRLIAAAKCYAVLAEHKGGKNWVLPRSESHIRPLVKLGEKEWVATWTKIVEKFAGEQFTAEDIQDFISPEVTVPTMTMAVVVAKSMVAKAAQAQLEKKLARIDKLVDRALEKAANKETITVKAYQTLLAKIKGLIAASK